MNDIDPKSVRSPLSGAPLLDRLLRSAALASSETAIDVPFGFDTRVVALWRAGLPNGSNGVARLVKRVAILAITIIVASSAAALYETEETRESSEPFANEFMIADSAIQSEFPQ